MNEQPDNAGAAFKSVKAALDATIAADTARRESERAELAAMHDAIVARDKRITELEAALRPFTRLVDHANRLPVQRDQDAIWAVNDDDGNDVLITQGDVRRAAEALHDT